MCASLLVATVFALGAGKLQADTLVGTGIQLQVGSAYASPLTFQLRYGAAGSEAFHTFSGVGAGNIHPDVLSNTALPYMYCVDILHDIFVPGLYKADVNTIGKIVNDIPYASGAITAVVAGQTVLANAGNIAYLMTTYAPLADTIDKQLALQAAIWHEVYGSNFVLAANPVSNSASATADDITVKSLYTTYTLAADSHTAPIDSVLWINPNFKWNGSSWVSGAFQAQVGLLPVPGTLTMSSILLGMVGAVVGSRRFKRQSDRSA